MVRWSLLNGVILISANGSFACGSLTGAGSLLLRRTGGFAISNDAASD